MNPEIIVEPAITNGLTEQQQRRLAKICDPLRLEGLRKSRIITFNSYFGNTSDFGVKNPQRLNALETQYYACLHTLQTLEQEEAQKYREIIQTFTSKSEGGAIGGAGNNDDAIQQRDKDLDTIAERIKEEKLIINKLLTNVKNKVARYEANKKSNSTSQIDDQIQAKQNQPVGVLVTQKNTSALVESSESDPQLRAIADYIISQDKQLQTINQSIAGEKKTQDTFNLYQNPDRIAELKREFDSLKKPLSELYHKLSEKITQKFKDCDRSEARSYITAICKDFDFDDSVKTVINDRYCSEDYDYYRFLGYDIAMLMILYLFKNANMSTTAQNIYLTNEYDSFSSFMNNNSGTYADKYIIPGAQNLEIITDMITYFTDSLQTKLVINTSVMIEEQSFPSQDNVRATLEAINSNITYARTQWLSEDDEGFGINARGATVIPYYTDINFRDRSLKEATQSNTAKIERLNQEKSNLEQQGLSLAKIMQKLHIIQEMAFIDVRYSQPLQRYVVYQKVLNSMSSSVLAPDSQTYIDAEERLSAQVDDFADKLENIAGNYNEYAKHKKKSTLSQKASFLINSPIPKKNILQLRDPHAGLRLLQDNLKKSNLTYTLQCKLVKSNKVSSGSERAVCEILESLINQLKTDHDEELMRIIGSDEVISVSVLFSKLCDLIQKDEYSINSTHRVN